MPSLKGGETYSTPGGDAYGMSSGLMGNAAAQTTGASNLNEATLPFLMGDTIANGMGNYMNPYTNSVVDATMGDIDRQRQIALTQNAGDAASSGAFAGGRHGLVDAATNEGAMRQMGLIGGDLRRQGFDTAGQFAGADVANRAGAFSDYFNRSMAGSDMGANLGKNYYNIGADVGQRQQQSGMMGQALSQGLLDAARGEFAGYSNAPQNALSSYIAALSGNPLTGATTTSGKTSSNPGTLATIGAGLNTLSNMVSFKPIGLK